jgi:phytoene/squalene synthetase
VRHGIPVTTPARTIDDLRRAVPERLARRARRQAELAGWRIEGGGDRTRSDLERDFPRLRRRHGLPRPEVNVKIGRWTVDFTWRREL